MWISAMGINAGKGETKKSMLLSWPQKRLAYSKDCCHAIGGWCIKAVHCIIRQGTLTRVPGTTGPALIVLQLTGSYSIHSLPRSICGQGTAASDTVH